MPRAFFSDSIFADNRGPLFMGMGLAIVLMAQLCPVIPLAAAISLIGLGATHTLKRSQNNELLLTLNLVIYASLAALAVAAQLNLHSGWLTQCDAILAIILILTAL